MVSLLKMPETLSEQRSRRDGQSGEEPVDASISVQEVDFHYGSHQVLHDVTLDIPRRAVTAFIGPSGCGKTTLLRCINRMNDLVDNARITRGKIKIDGVDINSPEVDVVALRRRVGMV
ncbi:MAG TPA: ATP-binding cassette domain-containing protein, partial [Chthoniobacterales bacterium]|nr:ATP-binding cassette domain-containing protein [Chthoniobacterales bacterium]